MRYVLTALVAFAVAAPATAQPTFDPRPTPDGPTATGANFTAARLQNPFFTPTTYRGAFAPGTGDAGRWDLPWANYDPQNVNYGPVTGATVISGQITTNTTLNANTRYLLSGFVYVRNGATLTIPAGTVIFGEQSTRGSLIVERGAQLFINGTANNPVIMTSAQPVGSRAAGDWGGLIILGRACINAAGGEATIEGGVGSTYGGGATCNDEDSSGSVRYMRLEYSGIAFGPDNEINGITMGGVGRGTVMEYLQVSYNGDDSFEWFGGTVNGKYFVSLGALDDDLDGDIGWRGNVQFALVIRDPNSFDVSGSTAFEQDNQAGGANDTPLTPRSRPTFSNVSAFGPLTQSPATPNSLFTRAVHIRRSSRAAIYNSVVLGWPRGLTIDGSFTAADANAGEVDIQHTILAGTFSSGVSTFDAGAWFTGRPGNVSVAAGTDGGAAAAGITSIRLIGTSNEDVPAALAGFQLSVSPNPSFGTPSAFTVDVPEASPVRVTVYDVLGRQVALVTEGALSAGTRAFSLGQDLPAGLYLARLETDRGTLTRQFTVVR